MCNLKDEWKTPKDLMSSLIADFDCVIDACASTENMKCNYRFLDASEDWEAAEILDCEGNVWGYEEILVGDESIFMNPPFSNPEPFLKRAWEFSISMPVICLVPSSILHNKYMSFLLEPSSESVCVWKPGIRILTLRGRTKFVPPKGVKATSPPFGCVLIIMDRRG